MIKISVVVPIYNVERYIGELVESLIRQTLKEIEIILVDDGSPDNSGEICDKYAANDNRIKVIHKSNGGVSSARNDGLAVAQGEFVIFCDSDDWLPLDAFAKMYDEAKRTSADVTIGDVYIAEDNSNKLVHFYEKSFVTDDRIFISKLIQADFYRTYCPMPPKEGAAFGYGGPWNKLVRRSLILENEITFDTSVKGIFDDIIYTAYVLANAKRIAYIQEPVYYYRSLSISITRTYKPQAIEQNKAIFKSWEVFMAKYDENGLFQKPFYATVIRRFIDIVPVYFASSKNPDGLFKRRSEMLSVINDTIYQEAIKNVEPQKLTSFQRQIWKLMRLKSPLCIIILYKVKVFLKSLK